MTGEGRTAEARRLAFDAVLDLAIDRLSDAVEQIGPGDVILLEKLSGVLLDLAILAGFKKDDLDREEQRAKIDKLRASTDAAAAADSSGVVLLPPIE